MSKPVKRMMIDMYRQQFDGVDDAVLVDLRGVKANDNNELRSQLAQKQIQVTVIKNTLARQAFQETGLEPLNELLEGPVAVAYGGESAVDITRELLGWARKLKELEVKGAVMDGALFGPDRIEELSNYPTTDEAQAQAAQLVLSPARRLAGQITGPGSKVAGLVKSVEEKLENGETIQKVA
jgi:large subunit ribosomal protein L10